MLRLISWILAGIVAILITVLVFLPAAWIAPLVEKQTGGRFTLGDAQGTVWNGSAFIGVAPSAREPVTPVLPGRFSWQLSPLVLLGQVRADVQNPAALARPVSITGTWSQWRISPSAVMLPAERLAGLGAPLNTLQPSGQMQLSWGLLQIARQGNQVDLTGTMNLEMNNIASRLSPIKPLGAYMLGFDWQGQRAEVVLSTKKGPLLLNGNGEVVNGRLRFSGRAEAEEGQEERLANLLNLLGQRRSEGGKDFIALEFR